MGEYRRDLLPDPLPFFEAEGVPLTGPGRWKTGPCHFHGGSDSLRVNTQSGGWCCMNCDAKGGDALAYAMQRYGLEFVQAARMLGAYVEDGRPHRGPARATTLTARESMELAAQEILIALLVISGIRAGVTPNQGDWDRFVSSARRLEMLASEYRT
jgi:CHC2 zinc finger